MQQHGIRARTKRKLVVTILSKLSLPVAPNLVQRRFTPRPQTTCGVETSATYRPTRAGCTWLRSSRTDQPSSGELEPGAAHEGGFGKDALAMA